MTFETLKKLNEKNKNAVPFYITSVNFIDNEAILMTIDNEKKLTKYSIDVIILSMLKGSMHLENPDILEMLDYEKISKEFLHEEIALSGN